jgi:rhodanese-related sulfurtransferase
MRRILREELQELLARGATLLDVLPDAEWDEAHIPGAVHLPLRQIDAETTARFDRSRPIVAYCFDFE